MAVTNTAQSITCDGCGVSLDSNTKTTKRLDKPTNSLLSGHWCDACAAGKPPKSAPDRPAEGGELDYSAQAPAQVGNTYTVGGPVPVKKIRMPQKL